MDYIKQYKKSIINFSKKENLNEIEYCIGILFLSIMNKYCKDNDISYHGYFVADSFIILFIYIVNKIKNNNEDNIYTYLTFYDKLIHNINYMNDRINDKHDVKKNINNNFYKYTSLINDYLIKINNYKYKKIESEYNYLMDNLLIPFFYVLFLTSKFMGSGIIENEPNLLKISEYYSNIFYTYILLNNNLDKEIALQDIFNNYTNNVIKIHEAYINIDLKSKTVSEIIQYIDCIVLQQFELKKN